MKVDEQQFNKLVRDKIPELIKEEGWVAETIEVKDDEVFKQVLLSKLEEEALEIGGAEGKSELLEELGDMETVVDALLEINGWTREELKIQQDKKDREKGVFKKRLYMKAGLRKDED